MSLCGIWPTEMPKDRDRWSLNRRHRQSDPVPGRSLRLRTTVCLAVLISTWAKLAKILQSRLSLTWARAFRETLPHIAHVIEFWLRTAQASFDVPKTFPICESCEGHAEKPVEARERWNKIHELSKDGSAGIHNKLSPSAEMRKYDLSAENISNRKVAFEKIISCFYKC